MTLENCSLFDISFVESIEATSISSYSHYENEVHRLISECSKVERAITKTATLAKMYSQTAHITEWTRLVATKATLVNELSAVKITLKALKSGKSK